MSGAISKFVGSMQHIEGVLANHWIFFPPDFDLQLENNTQIDGILDRYSQTGGFEWTNKPSEIPSNGGSAKPHVRPLCECKAVD